MSLLVRGCDVFYFLTREILPLGRSGCVTAGSVRCHLALHMAVWPRCHPK